MFGRCSAQTRTLFCSRVGRPSLVVCRDLSVGFLGSIWRRIGLPANPKGEEDGSLLVIMRVLHAICLAFLKIIPEGCVVVLGYFFSIQIPGSDAQNPRYVVNIANMVQYIRSNLVKCTARDRYGKETARIVEVHNTSTFKLWN